MACECCGVAFCPITFRTNVKRTKYCSKRCNALQWARNKSGWMPPPARPCSVCKTEFTPDNAHPHKQTCSKRCASRLNYANNKEAVDRRYREWTEANREKRRAIYRANYAKNREQKRIQKKARNIGSLSRVEFLDMCAECFFRCPHCTKAFPPSMLSIDHRVPVSKGGTNERLNLQILCIQCNKRKGNRYSE